MRKTELKMESGFTLIELVVAMAIFGVLAAIAYPNYISYVERTNRSDATSALLSDQQVLERCYSATFDYTLQSLNPKAACTTGSTSGASCGNSVSLPPVSNHGYYSLSCTVTSTTYSLTMAPASGGPQEHDACGSFTIDNNGNQTTSGGTLGSVNCWAGH
jgi:type IV pilus assembly protein PilE